MIKRYILCVFLFATSAFATIARVTNGDGTCNQPTPSIHNCTITVVGSGTGNTVIVGVATVPAASVSSIVDNGTGNTWTQKSQFSQTTIVREELWTCSPCNNFTQVTVNTTAGSQIAAATVSFSGVVSLGTTVQFGSAGVTAASANLTTQDANNYSVAFFANTAAITYTANVGTLGPTNSANSSIVCAINYNTSASPALLTNSLTFSSSSTSARGAIELRSTTAPSIFEEGSVE